MQGLEIHNMKQNQKPIKLIKKYSTVSEIQDLIRISSDGDQGQNQHLTYISSDQINARN